MTKKTHTISRRDMLKFALGSCGISALGPMANLALKRMIANFWCWSTWMAAMIH